MSICFLFLGNNKTGIVFIYYYYSTIFYFCQAFFTMNMHGVILSPISFLFSTYNKIVLHRCFLLCADSGSKIGSLPFRLPTLYRPFSSRLATYTFLRTVLRNWPRRSPSSCHVPRSYSSLSYYHSIPVQHNGLPPTFHGHCNS